jgi:hypothetical protein
MTTKTRKAGGQPALGRDTGDGNELNGQLNSTLIHPHSQADSELKQQTERVARLERQAAAILAEAATMTISQSRARLRKNCFELRGVFPLTIPGEVE